MVRSLIVVQQFCFSPDHACRHDGGSDGSGRPGWNMTYIGKCITMTTRSTLIGWSSCYKINFHKINLPLFIWWDFTPVWPHHQHTSTQNESKLSVLMSARILPLWTVHLMFLDVATTMLSCTCSLPLLYKSVERSMSKSCSISYPSHPRDLRPIEQHKDVLFGYMVAFKKSRVK